MLRLAQRSRTLAYELKSPTLSLRLLVPFERALRRAGVEPEVLSQGVGVRLDDLRGDGRISHADAIRMLDVAIAATKDPLLGLHAAELVRPGDFDALEYAARATPNLREAIARVARYLRLMHDAVELPLHVEGDLAFWTVKVEDVLRTRAENEYVVAVLLVAARLITGLNVRPLEVRLPGPAPEDTSEHVRVLSDVVRWDAPSAAIVFPAAALDWPLANPNPRLAAALAEHAERLLGELVATDQVTRRVREQIAVQLPAGVATIETVADKLKMSARTLRRRLEAENTTFSEQLDHVRRELAMGHVERGDRSFTEISFLLGFSSLGAFHRAFRRWHGCSPSEYRAMNQTRRSAEGAISVGQNVSPRGPEPPVTRRR